MDAGWFGFLPQVQEEHEVRLLVSAPMKTPDPHEPEENLFHAHLDVCAQCRNAPFGLCPEGTRTLEDTAKSSMVDFERQFGAPKPDVE